MIKSFTAIVALFAASQTQARFIPVGGTCANFAGLLPSRCVPGSICCYVYPDLGLCYHGKSCPTSFIPVGGLCSGVGGPSPLPCFPGTTCCNISPDNSQCLANCKSA